MTRSSGRATFNLDFRQGFLPFVLALCLGSFALAAGDKAPVGSKENPIKVNGVRMEKYYCKFLRTPGGEAVEYERVGSAGTGPYGNILDLYKVTTQDGKREWDIYIDMYHQDVTTLPQVAPPGLLTLQQYTASQLKGKSKEYIGISLPSGSQFCPIAALYGGQLVIARIAPTKGGRDITILRREADGWHPLGDRGGALMGNLQGYAFLDDMRVAPDKTLWVSSVFTFPYRTYIYRLNEGKWELAGPPEGDRPKSEVIWDSGLHFLGQGPPCRMIETRDKGISVLRLAGAEWVAAPIADRVREMVGADMLSTRHILPRERDTWLVWESRSEDQRVLRAACLTGPGADSLRGPLALRSLDQTMRVDSIAVSREGIIAVNITDRRNENGHVHLFKPDGAGAFSETTCRTTGKSSEFKEMEWGSGGKLFAVRESDDNALELLALNGRTWSVIEKHVQSESQGNIGETRMFFGPDGKPLVMWADWFR